MTDRPGVTAIVLAGGSARRFGRDKLREPVDGRPLIDHAIAAVLEVAQDVVVVTGSDAPRTATRDDQRVRSAHDPEPDGGPLVGLLAGLEVAREPAVLVVAGDMPRLSVEVLGMLLRRLAASDPDDVDAVVLDRAGAAQPLPVALRTGAATVAAARSVGDGERSLRGFIGRLRVRRLVEAEWRPLDPTAETLIDVDRPEDLRRLA